MLIAVLSGSNIGRAGAPITLVISTLPYFRSQRFASNEFDPVAKRIVNVAAAHARNVVRFRDLNINIAQSRKQSFVVSAFQRRMGLLCGAKIVLYAHMNLNDSALEPTAAAFCEFGRLRDFLHSKKA